MLTRLYALCEVAVASVRRITFATLATLAFGVVISAPASPSGSSRGSLPRAGKIVEHIAIPKGTGGFAIGGGAVWAMSDAASTLSRIDPKRNAVVARITVKRVKSCPAFPRSCGQVAAGEGAVWLTHPSDNTVTRVDAKTNRVTATIRVGPQPTPVVTTPGAVWVANLGGPTVSRIDPKTSRVVATIRLGPHGACCSEHMAMAASAGAVWVGVPGLYGVVRIDPAKNAVAARVTLSGQPCGFMAADADAVWAAGDHCASDVIRIDPRTNKEAGAIKGETAPIGLALGFGSLWVEDLDEKVIDRADPRTRRIVARLPLGGIPLQLAVAFGSLWARDDTGSVLRIQPAP